MALGIFVFLAVSCIFVSATNTNKIKAFPVESIYNIDMIADPDVYFGIIDKHLCGNKTNDVGKCCSCLPECVKYKLCCIDYFWYDKQFSSITEYYDYFTAKMRSKKSTTCSPIIPTFENSDYIRMVMDCPDGGKVHSSLDYPVRDEHGYVYKNEETARCNQVNQTVPLNIQAVCKHDPLNKTDESEPCIYEVIDRSDELLRCQPENEGRQGVNMVNNINTNSNSEMCESYRGEININNATYKNIHCFKRTGDTLKSLTIPKYCKSFVKPENVHQRMTFSIIINFGEVFFQNNNKVYKKITCKRDEIFDYVTLKCVKHICAPGYKKQNRACVLDKQTIGSITIKEDDKLEVKIKKCFLRQAIGEKIYLIKLLNHSGKVQSLEEFNISSLRVQSLEELDNFLSSATFQTFDSVHDYYRSPTNNLKIQSHFPRSRKCFKTKTIDLNASEIDSNCTLHWRSKIYNHDNFTVTIFKYNNKKGLDIKLHVCQKFYLEPDCPLKFFKEHEYISKDGLEMQIKNEEKIFKRSEYLPTENGIAVCISKDTEQSAKQKDWIIKANAIEQYLTIVSALMSIICYLVTMGTYLYFKELRQVSGLNIVSLCGFLLLSDIFLLLANIVKSEKGCKNTAILLHWALIGVLLSTFVISLEIALTFMGKVTGRSSSLKRYIKYLVFILMMSAIFVMLPYTLDAYDTFSMGYGVNDICWITSRNGRIIFYIIPWVIIIIISIAITAYVLKTIHKQGKVSKHLLNKTQDNNDLSITKTALKLIVLLGVIEIAGIIQIPETNTINSTFNVIFRFAYTTFRGFRGIFIFLMYVYLNKRVREHYACNKTKHQFEDSPTITRTSRISTKSNIIVKQNARTQSTKL